jgi:hypothetical protein
VFDGTLKFDTAIDKSGFEAGISKLGSIAKTGMAAVGAAVAVGTGAMAALGKEALNAYADYEQLTGGVSTLFGAQDMSLEEYAKSVGKTVDSAKADYDRLLQAQSDVLDHAAAAYKTAGMSQNEYMETVTSFSAALISSLDGDTVKAAQVADRAIVDMADNANKMGSSLESIQNAYQGFAKQNYTMLDNLKLGYGGTKSEMERLLADAEAISGVQYDISSYADVVEALHVIQTEMHISGISAEEAAELVASGALTEEEAFARMGTTAKEAATTIQGSMASLGAAWNNVLVGIADDEQDFDKLIDNLVSSAVTAADNILPRVETIIGGMTKLVSSMSGVVSEAIVDLTAYIPDMISAGISLIDALIDGITDNLPAIAEAVLDAGIQLTEAFFSMLPQVMTAGIDIISTLIQGIAEASPQLVDAAVDGITQLADGLTDAAPLLIDAGITLISSFTDLLIKSTPAIMSASHKLLMGVVSAIPKITAEVAKELPKIIDAVKDLLPELAGELKEAIPAIIQALSDSLPLIIAALCDALPDLVISLIDTAVEMYPVMLDGAIQLFTALVDALPLIIEKLIPKIPEIVVEVIGALLSNSTALADAAGELFMEIVKAIPKVIIALVSGLGDLWSTVKEWWAEKTSSASSALAEWFGNALNNAVQGAADIVNGVMQFLDELPGKIGKMLGEALGNIVKWCTEAPEKARDAANRFLDNIKTFFVQLPGSIRDQLDKAITRVTSWATDLKEKGRNAARGLVDTVRSGISSLPQYMADAGRSLVQSLWNGITGMGSWLQNRISDFGAGIIDGFKDAFGIHSPSAVMRDQVGRYIAQGIGVGFLEEIPDIGREAVEAFENIELKAPEVETPEIEAPDIEFEAPELIVRAEAPAIELPDIKTELPELTIKADMSVSDLEIPEIPDIVLDIVPDINASAIEALMDAVDWGKYSDMAWNIEGLADDMLFNVQNGAAESRADETHEYFEYEYDMDHDDIIKALEAVTKVVADIDSSAYSALNSESIDLSGTFKQTVAASEVINNSYTYSSTDTGRNETDSTQDIIINARFIVGEEVIAEGVKKIVVDEVDKQQGIDVQLKKRGLTT